MSVGLASLAAIRDHPHMPATNETEPIETAQPGSATGATIAVSVEEAAAHFGISPQAVRKRIAAGHLEAVRVGRSWSVYIAPQPSETAPGERFRETSKPHDTKLVAQSQRDQFALMVEPIVAPWVAKVEELSREAERNRGRAETAEQRLAAVEQERDELRIRLENEPSSSRQSVKPQKSPQTREDAPGREEGETLAPESNEAARGERRGGLGGVWDWLTGR